jgi:type 1 glutamine amidotransferase
MKKRSILISILVCANTFLLAQQKILIVTGGHNFEKKEFFEMFDGFEAYTYDWVEQPKANELIENIQVNKYQALVFYDMYQEISEGQKNAYVKLLNKGKGMVFLHHSLVSYQDWPEFQEIIGGKYLLEESAGLGKSTYRHDVDIEVIIAGTGETGGSIVNEMTNFSLHDEVYGNFVVNTNVTPLIKTTHPESTDIIGWAHRYKNSRIVYLQPGHDHKAYQNENYQKLVLRSIEWVIGSGD